MKKALLIITLLSYLTSCQNPSGKIQEPTNAINLAAIINNYWYHQLYVVEARQFFGISNHITSFFQDSRGYLWIGTREEGLVRFDGKSFAYFKTQEGLGGNQIHDITEDQSGNIWIATNGGISKMSGEQFDNFGHAEGLPRGAALQLQFNQKNELFAGTVQGLFQLKEDHFETIPLPDLPSQTIISLTGSPSGQLWIGTEFNGLYRYDGQTFKHFAAADGLCSNSISSLLLTPAGDLLVGSALCGISIFKGDRFELRKDSRLPQGREIHEMSTDEKGNLWLAAGDLGLYRFSSGEFTQFGKKEGLPLQQVETVLVDNSGLIWIGGRGGLYMFDGESFKEVTRDGLC